MTPVVCSWRPHWVGGHIGHLPVRIRSDTGDVERLLDDQSGFRAVSPDS